MVRLEEIAQNAWVGSSMTIAGFLTAQTTDNFSEKKGIQFLCLMARSWMVVRNKESRQPSESIVTIGESLVHRKRGRKWPEKAPSRHQILITHRFADALPGRTCLSIRELGSRSQEQMFAGLPVDATNPIAAIYVGICRGEIFDLQGVVA